jgi:hypothetical protein
MTPAPPKLGNSYGSFSLNDARQIVIGSWSGGAKDNSIVKALVEIREVQRSSGGKVLWSHSWSFDATPVSEIPHVGEGG